jgi:site-specific DNA-methyltransferase (adenine-specific)
MTDTEHENTDGTPEPTVTLHYGDCLEVLRTLPDDSVHCVITDPPYGLAEHKPATIVTALTAWANGDRDHVPTGRGFMGRDWDAFVPPPAVWDECLRVLKPGGHLAVFAGSRTVDLMGLSIRLAGFEMRDGIAAWLYGSGFPKSLEVGKAIERSKVTGDASLIVRDITAPATDAARTWDGWGTALKPAHEPILIARKPLGGTVAATVLAHGTGAINVDACRVGMSEPAQGGRWPTNVVLAHHPGCGPDEAPGPCVPGCQVAELDRQSGQQRDGLAVKRNGASTGGLYEGGFGRVASVDQGYGGQGGASRYFPTFRYQAKAPKRERPTIDGKGWPTVKPLGLMEWLVRLLCPPGGTVLEPFTGSGATLEAARNVGVSAIAAERDRFAYRLAHVRLGWDDPGDAEPVADPDPVVVEVPSPTPISEAACDVHGPHPGTVDCLDCLAQVNTTVDLVVGTATRFPEVPGVAEAAERAEAATTVAEAQAARDDLKAALVAARTSREAS